MYSGMEAHPSIHAGVANEYFIRHRPEKNLINENAKQGVIDNLQ